MDNVILKHIAKVNGSTRGSRTEQVKLVRAAIENGEILRDDIDPIFKIISDLPLLDSNGDLITSSVFANEQYLSTAILLKEIFSASDAREIVNIFLNISNSEFHREMRRNYNEAIEKSDLTREDADFILLVLILVDYRVNVQSERKSY